MTGALLVVRNRSDTVNETLANVPLRKSNIALMNTPASGSVSAIGSSLPSSPSLSSERSRSLIALTKNVSSRVDYGTLEDESLWNTGIEALRFVARL